MAADIIDYRIVGDDMQGVIITLDPGEAVFAEAGGMMYMEEGIEMATTLDPSGQAGGMFGKLLGAGKRLLMGESFFITMFGNSAGVRRDVAFATPTPGKIFVADLKQWGGEMIAQKDAFLCAARGIDLDIAFTKKLGVGFFGGEGFILQRLKGDGLAFLSASGTLIERDLKPGEVLRIDTGCLVAMQASVQYDIEMVKGVKNMVFGGEGMFYAKVRGPGRVIMQTLPFSRLAARVLAHAPASGRQGSSAGGILGGIIGDKG